MYACTETRVCVYVCMCVWMYTQILETPYVEAGPLDVFTSVGEDAVPWFVYTPVDWEVTGAGWRGDGLWVHQLKGSSWQIVVYTRPVEKEWEIRDYNKCVGSNFDGNNVIHRRRKIQRNNFITLSCWEIFVETKGYQIRDMRLNLSMPHVQKTFRSGSRKKRSDHLHWQHKMLTGSTFTTYPLATCSGNIHNQLGQEHSKAARSRATAHAAYFCVLTGPIHIYHDFCQG